MPFPAPIHTVFFDLDDTLYTKKTGVCEAVRGRISSYMTDVLHIPAEQAEKERTFYFKEYGLTLKGLQCHYKVDPSHYLDYVHGGLELSKHLTPDPVLRTMLHKMRKDIKKIVFSNADKPHCDRVMKALNIDDLFDGVLDYLQMVDNCKPTPKSYELAILLSGATDYSHCVFLDDSIGNLISAKEKGMTTVLVGSKISHPSIDYCIDVVTDFERLFPELFVTEEVLAGGA